MNLLRKSFYVFTFISIIILSQSCCKQTENNSTKKSESFKGNGFYVVPNLKSQKEVDELISYCKKLDVNKVFILTKDTEGQLLYPSKKYPVSEKVKGFNSYEAICKAAQKENIRVHAWFVIFYEGYDNPTPIIKEHPEYLIVHRNGKTSIEQPPWITVKKEYASYWVCPTAKGYREYLKGMMKEVIDTYNVDGIHLDYIRYPEEVNAREYCYCERCKALFKENYGYTLPENDVIKNRFWVTQMCDNVANAVKDFSEFVHKNNKLISAYVFTDYPTAIEAIYQDWPWFSRYLDFIVPTSYESSTSYIHTMAERTRAVLNKKCALYPAIFSVPSVRRSEDGGKRWYKGKAEDIYDTYKAWIDEKVNGVVFFTYNSLVGSKLLTDEQRQETIEKVEKLDSKYFGK